MSPKTARSTSFHHNLQDDTEPDKYRFPYSGFIFYSALISIALFFVFLFTIFITFWQFSSNNSFDKEFFDSCYKQNDDILIEDLFKLRSKIYENQQVSLNVQKIFNNGIFKPSQMNNLGIKRTGTRRIGQSQ